MKRWAYSIIAIKHLAEECGMQVSQNVGFVEAETLEDADAVALAVSRSIYPESDGWVDHQAVTISDDARADTPEHFTVDGT